MTLKSTRQDGKVTADTSKFAFDPEAMRPSNRDRMHAAQSSLCPLAAKSIATATGRTVEIAIPSWFGFLKKP